MTVREVSSRPDEERSELRDSRACAREEALTSEGKIFCRIRLTTYRQKRIAQVLRRDQVDEVLTVTIHLIHHPEKHS